MYLCLNAMDSFIPFNRYIMWVMSDTNDVNHWDSKKSLGKVKSGFVSKHIKHVKKLWSTEL